MLSKSTVNAVEPLIVSLEQASKVVGVKQDTVLSALKMASYSPTTTITELGNWQQQFVDSLSEVNTYSKSDGAMAGEVHIAVTSHSVAMAELIDLLTLGTNNALNIARNVVTPLVSTVIETVKATVVAEQRPRELWEVVELKLHAAWSNPIIKAALRNIDEHHTPITSGIPRLDCPEGLKVTTGNDILDATFTGILAELKITVNEVWNDLFQSNSVGGYPQFFEANHSRLMAQFILANWLTDNPIADSGMGLGTWKELLGRITMAVGNQCNSVESYFIIAEADGRLIFNVDGANFRIYVLANIYDRWINAGGEVEILIGAIMTSSKWAGYSVEVLLERKEEFLATWQQHHASRRSIADSNTLITARAGLRVALCGLIKSIDRKYFPVGISDTQLLVDIDAQVARLNTNNLNCMAEFCRDSVCEVFFKSTAANFFLIRMETLCAEGASLVEAEETVIIEYVTDWICANYTVLQR